MSTAWSDRLGIRHPLVCAPMGGVAGGRLATAVSRAGALGMIGMGSAGSPEALARELALVPDGVRVGIGLVDWVMRSRPELLDAALAARPVLLSVSFGDDFDWVARAHDVGVATVTQVPDVAGAERAAAAGVDLIVARGLEGGGHGRPLSGLADLLSRVLAAVEVPVLAAGAIATADDVRRVRDTGAAGVWVGTAFAACPESLLGDADRTAMLRGADTVLTSEFDRRSGYAWPEDVPERVLAGEPRSIDAGLGVRALTAARPAGDVVESLAAGLYA
ncbi:NAD(P)H-dependent flavin oxidoreductase [Microbacterium lacusdiani]